jgi:hypothetical protein
LIYLSTKIDFVNIEMKNKLILLRKTQTVLIYPFSSECQNFFLCFVFTSSVNAKIQYLSWNCLASSCTNICICTVQIVTLFVVSPKFSELSYHCSFFLHSNFSMHNLLHPRHSLKCYTLQFLSSLEVFHKWPSHFLFISLQKHDQGT